MAFRGVLEYVEHDMLREDASESIASSTSKADRLKQLNDKLQATIDLMKKAQQEAKYEIVLSHYAPPWYKPIVRSLDRMAAHMFGLALTVQRANKIILEQRLDAQLGPRSKQKAKYMQHENDILEYERMNIHEENMTIERGTHVPVISPAPSLHRLEYKHISRLQASIQPAMKHFIQCCTDSLNDIQEKLASHKAIPRQFRQQKKHDGSSQSSNLSASTIRDNASTRTVDASGDMEPKAGNLAEVSLTESLVMLQSNADETFRAEYELTAPSEDHFLVYTLLYTLIAFGKELIAMEEETDLLFQRRRHTWPRIFFPGVQLRKWLLRASDYSKGIQTEDERAVLGQQEFQDRTQRMHEDEAIQGQAGSSSNVEHEKDWGENEPLIPLQNAPGRHFWNKWFSVLNNWIEYGPTRYAIKFTVTMELLAFMAWLPIDGVNDLYNVSEVDLCDTNGLTRLVLSKNNHGQWALLSAMVVSNFTVGATAVQCMYRVVATIIGAVCGYIALLAAHRNENPYVLAVMILIFQVPMWYILLGTKYPRIGFISLLTMGVICSTDYTDMYGEDLFDPVWKRTLTAVLAIIVVMLVDQFVFPVWARKSMRKSLSDLLIDTGIQFSKVASLACQANTQTPRFKETHKNVVQSAKLLQKQYALAHQMLNLAGSEPRLTKGPFPAHIYQEIFEYEKKILYWIQHTFEAQDQISPAVRKRIMLPMTAYRKEMAAAVHLYLFTLAGSLRTKSALPAALPSAEIARRTLQSRQLQLWREHYQSISAEDSHPTLNQMYWNTFASGSVEIIMLQEAIGALVIKLMGQHYYLTAAKDWTKIQA